jgi:hypothetical protein
MQKNGQQYCLIEIKDFLAIFRSAFDGRERNFCWETIVSSMRKESGRLRAVREATPVTNYWQPLTSVPKAPALFYFRAWADKPLQRCAICDEAHNANNRNSRIR